MGSWSRQPQKAEEGGLGLPRLEVGGGGTARAGSGPWTCCGHVCQVRRVPHRAEA